MIDELGGPNHFNHYPWGWTWAGNTPFRRWKRETYRGGVSDPFIVTGRRDHGEGRGPHQYAHAIDMVPTVLDVLGIEPPVAIRGVTQAPLHGVSFAHTFDDATAESRRRTQYFEMLGYRAIYKDGWRAVCPWPGPSFTEAGVRFGQAISAETLSELDATGWELYHVAEDFAENHNVAAEHRDKLIEMIGTWYVEAGKYDVCRSTAAASRAWSRRSRSSHRRAIATATGRGRSRSRSSPARRAQPAAQHHGEGRDPGGRRRRCPALPGHRGRRLLALHQGREAALRAQLRRTRTSTASTPRTASHPAGTSSDSSSSRPGEPDLAAGKGAPATRQLTSTTSSSPTPRCPSRRRS